jgi:hypothetical protein
MLLYNAHKTIFYYVSKEILSVGIEFASTVLNVLTGELTPAEITFIAF